MTAIDKLFKEEGFDKDEYDYGIQYINKLDGFKKLIIDFREWGDMSNPNYRVVVTNFGVDKYLAKLIILKMEEKGW